MALPAGNQPWPPPAYEPALKQVRNDLAWVTGDMSAILDQVGATHPQPYRSRAQYNGGIIGGVARGVLGKPPRMNPDGNATIERHLPVAAELVGTSADLLADKPTAVTLHPDDAPEYNDEGELVGGNVKAAESLDALTSSDTFASEIWDAFWHVAAAGWVFGRIVWNLDVRSRPWIEWVDADHGFAEFANGEQVAVTFFDTHPDPNGKAVFRLLQRHSPGRIEYGLYKGSETELGMRVPVTEHPDTAYLADLLDADAEIKTGTTMLTARMIRNREKNPAWRNHPTLRYYGRSDVSKGGGLWEDIDKGWTEFWHEVESGRHRLLVSEDLLKTGAPGEGSFFEWFRDVFTVGQSGDPDAGPTIESVQPELRTDKLAAVVDMATRKAIDAVGLSPITVGMDPQASGEMTATEIRSRSDKTLKTFGGKARQARAGLSELLTAYLHMDAQINGYQPPTRLVNVAIPEPVQDTDKDRAERAQSLRAADAASTYYLVRDLHPEWTPREVDEEVARIVEERRAGMPADPFNVGADAPFGSE